MTDIEGIDPVALPSGPGCMECEETGGWWVHLRRCAACGHVGCCDTSPSQHATKHFQMSGHRLVQSYEPDESWFYDYGSGDFARGPALAAPTSRPRDQSVPGPTERVPADWQEQLNG